MVTATNVDAKLLVRQQGQLNWNFHPRIQSDLSVSLPSGALPMNPAGVCRLRMSPHDRGCVYKRPVTAKIRNRNKIQHSSTYIKPGCL